MADVTGGGVISYEVTVNGSPIPGDYQIFKLSCELALNKIPTARITLLDGNPSSENFTISASANFVPGAAVSIKAGYNGVTSLIFSGIVTKQIIRVDNQHGPVLDVECRDKAIKLVVGRKSQAWTKSKDSDAMSAIISAAGLSAEVTATQVVHEELVQYYASDWDFLVMRAEINSMVVKALNGKLSVFSPVSQTQAKASITYGDDVYAFQAELNAVTQLNQVKASAWDYPNQKILSESASNDLPGPGNLSSKKLAGVLDLAAFELQTSAAEGSAQLSGWAAAQLLKSELSKIRGMVRVQGRSQIVPGDYLTLDGFGTRFDGDHLVSAVQHELENGNWMCEYHFGMPFEWFVETHAVQAAPAAGLLPGMPGLFNATVKQIHSDPDNEYRILVELALYNDKQQGVWARLTNFYSTNGQGAFFLPEVGDEVILGFLNQDPRYPIILGSVYSQKNKPYSEFVPNAENSMKGIVSKKELRILFNDKDQILSIVTPNNNTMVFDDKSGTIKIEDQNSNSMLMSSSGISIKSPKSITIEAQQNVTIKGNTGVKVESSAGDVNTSALNIKESANLEYAAQGSTTASVKGGVQLTLQAAMVMIN